METLLVPLSFVIIFVSWLLASRKTGYIAYSPWSYLKSQRPSYAIDKNKTGTFLKAFCAALLLNVLLAFSITRNIALVVAFSLFNMLFITYTLMYWILLKERKT